MRLVIRLKLLDTLSLLLRKLRVANVNLNLVLDVCPARL